MEVPSCFKAHLSTSCSVICSVQLEAVDRGILPPWLCDLTPILVGFGPSIPDIHSVSRMHYSHSIAWPKPPSPLSCLGIIMLILFKAPPICSENTSIMSLCHRSIYRKLADPSRHLWTQRRALTEAGVSSSRSLRPSKRNRTLARAVLVPLQNKFMSLPRDVLERTWNAIIVPY